MMADETSKKEEVAHQIEKIESEKMTAKMELSWKDGKLMAGTLINPFLK